MRAPFIICLFFSLIITGIQAQDGWYELTSGVTNQLNGIDFFDEDRGIAVGRMGTVLKTTDGGLNWNQITVPTTTHLNAVYYYDSSEIYAVSLQSILKSTNGGNNWSLQNATAGGNAVHFPSHDVGYVVGEYGSIVKTFTASVTWVVQSSGTTENLNCVYFINDNTGIAAGENGVIIKTTNGGNNWNSVSSGTSLDLVDICFVNSSTAYIAGVNPTSLTGIILKSTDGGSTWSTLYTCPYELKDIRFTGSDTAYAVGSDPALFKGLILKSTDGGTNWSQQYCPTLQALHEVDFINSEYGFASGVHGTILKTTNGGVGGGSNITETNIDAEIDIFPNPCNGYLHLQIPEYADPCSEISVYDNYGKLVKHIPGNEIHSNSLILNCTDNSGVRFKPGLYPINIIFNNFCSTRRIIVL